MTRSGVFAAEGVPENPAVGCPEQPPAPTDSNCIAETVSSLSTCLSSKSSSSSGLENVEDLSAEPSISGAGVSSLILNRRTRFFHFIPRTSAKRHADAQNVSSRSFTCWRLAQLVVVCAELGSAAYMGAKQLGVDKAEKLR